MSDQPNGLMTEAEARLAFYYFLLNYFARIDPSRHFRGVIDCNGHSRHWWPEVIWAIENDLLVPGENR